MTTNAIAAPIHIHALVAVSAARAASSAASLMRAWAAASAAPDSSAVINGSTTAEPDVKRKTGFRASMITASRACRTLGAIQ